MDCYEARRLLDMGVIPGSTDQQRRLLGFHLSSCAACRAYRQHPHEQLLSELFAEQLPDQVPAPPSRPRWGSLRYALLALLALLLIGGGYLAGTMGIALLTIQRNVQAMRLPTAPLGVGMQEQAPREPVPTPIDPALLTAVPARLAMGTPPSPELPSTSPGAEGAVTIPSDTSANGIFTPLPTRTPRPVLGMPAAGGRELPVTPRTPIPTLRPTVAGAGGPVTARPAGAAVTILLLGSDQRPDESYATRNDAIAIVRIDPQRQRVALLSLPRDLVVEIPGYGYGRINAASVYGELNPQLGGGIELTRATVSKLIGAQIDYVVQMNFSGFIGAINAIGGIDIDVQKELYDPSYPTIDYGYMVVHFLPGLQHMDGETALIYARVRHMDSDFERMSRQQEVIVSVMRRVHEQHALQQVQSVAAVTSELRSYVQTDIPQERIVSLAWAFRNFNLEAVERYRLDASMVAMNVIPGDPYAQVALPGSIEELSALLLEGQAP